ncbi:MAG TPA: tRNA epoxyqueuosine(34) reductase QueG [Stellaceae bacterium]|nr:tRNA epoxyqueuosine(34) reductase QueG [Stellaceae bacterium]
MSAAPAAIKAAIRDEALKLGFDAIGFCASELGPEARRDLERYLAAGYHGDMGWLAARAKERASPRQLWPDVKSVVVLGLSYAPEGDPLAGLGASERGAVSVYAHGRDYHDLVKSRLKALASFIAARWPGALKVFVDTAPVMEKPLAAQAGIGWQGKHTNLVSRRAGSWLFLGEIYLSLELPPDAPHEDRCGTCQRCLDACPTAAFPAPHRLDARRCISYLTIEHKGHIARELRPLIGNRIYGCDDCLAVCPWNKFARAASLPALTPREELRAPRLAELAALDDKDFRKLFSGSPLKRVGRDRFVRNVLIAIGNSGAEHLLDAAMARLDDRSPLVRAMAVWAVRRLATPQRSAALAAQFAAGEADPEVRAEWETSSPLDKGDPVS